MTMLSRVAECVAGLGSHVAQARRLRRASTAALCVLVSGLSPIALFAAAPEEAAVLAPIAVDAKTIERFYAVEMMGGRAGWMHSKETTALDGTITTDSVVDFTLKRGPVSIDVRIESQFVETAKGEPVSMRSFQRMAKIPMETSYTFAPDGVHVSSVQGGGEPINKLEPMPEGEWLTPAAAERFVKARRAAGTKTVIVRTIDPSTGLTPVVVERIEGEVEKMTVLGREIDVIKSTLKTKLNGQNIESLEYSDVDGVLVKTKTSIGGIDVVMTLMSREDAMKEGVAPEIMVATFLSPDKPIERPRQTTRATYTLISSAPEFDTLPTTGSQRVERIDASTLKVEIDASMPNAPGAAEADAAAFTKPSPMANSDDPAIRDIAAAGVKDLPEGASNAQKAEALRRAAHAYINAKNLGVGFASASEVAKTRTGDCTEHGVFLVALLRARGIPARAAAGLIYADQFAGSKNIFGYHMWAQALLDTGNGPRWVDLDATFPDAIPFDATHITLSTTDLMGDDAASSLMPIATVMGRLSIKVNSVEHAGGDK